MVINELFSNLTKRELEALENVVLMGNVKGAAKAMNISPRTIECYMEHIKTKLKLQYKSQLNKIYIENFYERRV